MKGLIKPLIFSVIIFCNIALVSCGKKDKGISFFWAQTGCSDPWKVNSNSTEPEIESAVTEYLSKENVNAQKIQFEFDQNLAQLCKACYCKTGLKIIVTTPRNKSRKMKKLGFKEI